MNRRPSKLAALATLLASVFVAFALVVPALADEYQYTVRVFSGNRGTFAAEPVTVTVPKGTSLNLYDMATATVTDSKYIQIGFRRSGTDSLLGNGQINGIAEDMDFVVAYGVEANMVPYTLQFVEYGTGRQLAEPKTFYGGVGEKPVAAFEYIEGYRPLYLAITGTLHEDEDNVWTFEYIPLAEGETVVTTTTSTTTTYTVAPTAPTTVVETPTNAGTVTTTTTTGTAATTTEGAAAGTEGGATATEGGAAATTEGGEAAEPQTQEILDLDTPLAGPGAAGNQGGNGLRAGATLLTNPVAIGVIGAGLAALAGLVLFFVLKRKKGEENEEA